jgi:hypothetical protein
MPAQIPSSRYGTQIILTKVIPGSALVIPFVLSYSAVYPSRVSKYTNGSMQPPVILALTFSALISGVLIDSFRKVTSTTPVTLRRVLYDATNDCGFLTWIDRIALWASRRIGKDEDREWVDEALGDVFQTFSQRTLFRKIKHPIHSAKSIYKYAVYRVRLFRYRVFEYDIDEISIYTDSDRKIEEDLDKLDIRICEHASFSSTYQF